MELIAYATMTLFILWLRSNPQSQQPTVTEVEIPSPEIELEGQSTELACVIPLIEKEAVVEATSPVSEAFSSREEEYNHLLKMSIRELKRLAAIKGLKKYSNMNKAALALNLATMY